MACGLVLGCLPASSPSSHATTALRPTQDFYRCRASHAIFTFVILENLQEDPIVRKPTNGVVARVFFLNLDGLPRAVGAGHVM